MVARKVSKESENESENEIEREGENKLKRPPNRIASQNEISRKPERFVTIQVKQRRPIQLFSGRKTRQRRNKVPVTKYGQSAA